MSKLTTGCTRYNDEAREVYDFIKGHGKVNGTEISNAFPNIAPGKRRGIVMVLRDAGLISKSRGRGGRIYWEVM